MGDAIKEMIKNKVVMAVVSLVIGLMMLVMGSGFVAGVIKAVGVILLVAAAVYILMYLTRKADERSASSIVVAVICAVVGIIFLAMPGFFVNIFPFIMGVVLILSGIMDISQIVANFVGTPGQRTAQILIAVLVIVLGLLCLLKPGLIADYITYFIGISLIVNGVYDLIILFTHREA